MLALAILLGALAARLLFVFVLPLRLQWPDSREFEEMGRVLWSQGTYGLLTLRPPGYPTFIAGVYALFGPHLLALRLVEAVLSTVAVALVGVLGVRWLGRGAGLIAMALAAFHPMLAFLPSTQYTETLSFFLMMVMLVAAFAAFERGGAWRWALTGLLLGAQTLVRPNAIAFLPGFGLGFAWLLHRGGRGWVMPALVTALAFGAAIAPWMIRGQVVFHRWYFISTGGGRQFWLGNNESATGDTRIAQKFDPVIQAQQDSIGNTIDADRFLLREGQRWMREHPGRAAALYVRKMANIFALFPETSTGTYVNPASRVSQGIASVVIFAGALLGLARVRAHPPLWPLLLGTLTFALATAFAFSSMRYRMFFEPCLILAAGAGWASLLPAAARSGSASRTPTVARATSP